jgi:hypothetical protein
MMCICPFMIWCQWLNHCWNFLKLDLGVLYRKMSSKQEFCENWHSDIHALLEGLNEIYLYFLHILSNVRNSVYRRCSRAVEHWWLSWKCNECNESHTARVLITFCPYFSHFICFWKQYTIVSYVKMGAVKTALYLMMSYTSVCTLHIYFVIWVNCGVRCLNIMLLAFMGFMNIGTGKTVLFVWLYMRLHLYMYIEPHILKLTNSSVMSLYYVMEYMISELAIHILRE